MYVCVYARMYVSVSFHFRRILIIARLHSQASWKLWRFLYIQMIRLVHQSLHGDLTSTKNPLISLLFERYPTSTHVGNKLLTKLEIKVWQVNPPLDIKAWKCAQLIPTHHLWLKILIPKLAMPLELGIRCIEWIYMNATKVEDFGGTQGTNPRLVL